MDIEMIKFTGILSIMLIISWILITIIFIIISDNKTKPEEIIDDKNT